VQREEDTRMKYLTLAMVIAVTMAWGCAPSDQPSTEAVATPAASAGDEITEMDFESGEVEQTASELKEPEAESTPDVP
jgi:hypothetical protein